MARSISRPLAGMVATARRLATGDVTQRVEYQGSDEIGQLAAALNTMAAHLRQMLTQVRDTTAALNTVSGDLTTASAQLAQRVDAMGDTTTATASKANDMSTNMTVAAATTEQATSNVRLIATATEEMIATVNEIAQNAEKSRQVTAAAVESVHTACGRVDELGQAAQEISLVTDVIMEIAEQTKLLALNATIEAARAGEAGKGFAVVANEVKALATQTNAATEDIRQKVEAMQRSTDSTVREITQIQQVMSDVNDLVASIASAVEEQAITTRDIAGNTGQAVTGLHAMVQTVTAATAVAGEMAGEMGTVHASSRELEATSDQLKQQATTLTQIGQALHNVVETFHL
jgi:methyl-accepting chemotaxis protein